ncbi:MAG: hypothetical protein ABSB94_13785 [Syntrophorhabdales bacterium]|jgi:hypothetical protein
MTFTIMADFKARTSRGETEFKKGQIITMAEDKAHGLLAAGKIAELKPCHVCNEYAWWLSIHGVLVCGICHPPAPGTVKKWIGDQEAVNRMKVARPAVVLSWQEIRGGKAARDRQR